ncbi:MAG: hypothetical protein ACR2H9_07365 [Longimicrobiaceae bacterium]
MTRLTPEWTEAHARLLPVLVTAAVGTAVAAWGDDLWLALAISVLFAATAVVGLTFEPFIALVVGLVGAACMILLEQLSGVWVRPAFAASALQTAFFIATGLLAGIAGNALRRIPIRAGEASASLEEPTIFYSLGLLRSDLGELRLEEEVERARLHHRPLAILRVVTDLREEAGLSPAEQGGLYRTVARLVGSMLRPTDVPFAYEECRLGAILPETHAAGALLVLSPIVDAVTHATFLVRSKGGGLCLHDYARVYFAFALFPEHGETAAELLEVTHAAVQGYREQSGIGYATVVEHTVVEIESPAEIPLVPAVITSIGRLGGAQNSGGARDAGEAENGPAMRAVVRHSTEYRAPAVKESRLD